MPEEKTLAFPTRADNGIFSEPIGELAITEIPLNLVVIDLVRGIRSDENGECFHSIDFSKQTDRNFAVISQYFALKPPQFPPAFGAKPPATPQVGQPQLAPTLEVRAFSNSRLPT